MAKTPFTKLKCQVNKDIIPVQIGDETIGVKQYLPLQEKLALMERVIEQAHNENYDYANPVLMDVITDLEIVYAYTDISFTDKQKEDVPKTYDALRSSGVLTTIFDNIPREETSEIITGIYKTSKGIYEYRNSVKGILEHIKNNYDEFNFDTTEIIEKLGDAQNLEFVKDLLTKIG